MKYKLPFLAALFLMISLVVQAQTYRIATYNLRFDNPSDTGNLWAVRGPVAIDLIRFHDFDIFGTQEALIHQLEAVTSALPQYARTGVGRSDGKEAGEFSAIFYRKDRFRLLKHGDFWLSETPDRPSLGWDATCCNRICSWGQFQDIRSGKKFYVFNAHFDHQGKVARVESARLVLKKINAIAGSEPVVLTGDFNGDHDSGWYRILEASELLKDTFREVKHPYITNPTFNNFGRELGGRSVIDHIFISRHFRTLKWGVLTDSYGGKYPSDHFPVVADLTL
ncbi:MAG TPA: endonuclease/exonuclease/phosphatase family protein [Sphingobacteriaceae bacterium]